MNGIEMATAVAEREELQLSAICNLIAMGEVSLAVFFTDQLGLERDRVAQAMREGKSLASLSAESGDSCYVNINRE